MRKNKLLLLLALLMTAATGAWAQDTYKVSMKDGVKDADKWTISPNPAPEGSPVTIQYTGRLKARWLRLRLRTMARWCAPQAICTTLRLLYPADVPQWAFWAR